LSRFMVPIEWRDAINQAGRDFDLVTDKWVREGWHTRKEVEEWRGVIARDMQNEISADSAIDPRPRNERIGAWCKTWRELAIKVERGVL
jgi:hypothetical protein